MTFAAPRLTLRNWWDEFVADVLSIDGRLLRTLRALIGRPGHIAREWIEGERTRWASPLRLYLVASLVMFGTATALPEDPLVAVRGQTAATVDPARVMSSAGMSEEVQRSGPTVLFVLVPFFALLTRAAFRRARLYYPEHLVFALNAHSVVFTALALALLLGRLPDPYDYLDGLPMAGAVVWLFFGTNRFFQMGTARTLLTTTAVFIIHLAVVMIGLMLPAAVRHDSAEKQRARAERLYQAALADTGAHAAQMRAAAVIAYQRLEAHMVGTHVRYHLAQLVLADSDPAEARRLAEEALVRAPENLLALGIAAEAAERMDDAAAANAFRARFRAAYSARRSDAEYSRHSAELEAYATMAGLEERGTAPPE